MHHIFDLHLPNKQARRFYMTRTRPGSIIRECLNGGAEPAILCGLDIHRLGWISCMEHTVRHVTRHCATTTQGYKIRSWIVVKE
jgi:hypothetical protein